MKFKIGDKVKITDRSAVCGCCYCQDSVNRLGLDYTYTIDSVETIDAFLDYPGLPSYILVKKVGLKKACEEENKQLLFDFMY